MITECKVEFPLVGLIKEFLSLLSRQWTVVHVVIAVVKREAGESFHSRGLFCLLSCVMKVNNLFMARSLILRDKPD